MVQQFVCTNCQTKRAIHHHCDDCYDNKIRIAIKAKKALFVVKNEINRIHDNTQLEREKILLKTISNFVFNEIKNLQGD